ncbi:MAG: hypothetical protein WBP59_16370, partial [Ilumatobacteraceae bacterium]
SRPALDDLRERWNDRAGERAGRPGAGNVGRHNGGPFSRGAGVASEALTDLLDLDAAELRTQLRDGATLADIAESAGIDVQAVIDELMAETSERFDTAVENGRLDQSAADEKLAEIEAKITEMVNTGLPSHDGSGQSAPSDSPDSSDAED